MDSLLKFWVTPGDIVYDIETHPNIFTCNFLHTETEDEWFFEISDRRNDIIDFLQILDVLRKLECRLVGFNNIGFDEPVVHAIDNSNGDITVSEIYTKAMSIIQAPDNRRFANLVSARERTIPQLDLFKICHFDNKARATSLKMLEFNMRMDSIEDLPFEPGTILTGEQKDLLKPYNKHDTKATLKFYKKCKDKIRFREELTEKYNHDFMNHNDTKIGKDYFIMELEKANPGCCYKHVNNRRCIVQTPRDQIVVKDILLPYLEFNHSEFKRIHETFKNKVITETKGVFDNLSCTVNGIAYDFGTGGLHSSVPSQIVESDDEYMILDLDVASYYPNLAIANRLYPEHLGETFCTIYKDVYEQRKGYAKGTAENAMLKLALNGVYGDSNNQYSPLYDPQYTMSITINGQLLLCMLAEAMNRLPSMQIIQVNTDGITIKFPRRLRPFIDEIVSWWQDMTGLELEGAEYSRMMIRDVNNYIAEYADGGKLKRKGCYEYQLDWHQNHSALVVPMAAEAALVRGVDVAEFIRNHDDVLDFMLRTKVPRNSRLEWGGEQVQNIARYYISINGRPLEKVMPPKGSEGAFKRANGLTDAYYDQVLEEVGDTWDERIHTKNKSRYETRRIGINTGWGVTICNNLTGRTFEDLNYEWYIQEARKIVTPLLRG